MAPRWAGTCLDQSGGAGQERDSGKVRRTGKTWTFGQWLTHWAGQHRRANVRENMASGYGLAIRVHLSLV